MGRSFVPALRRGAGGSSGVLNAIVKHPGDEAQPRRRKELERLGREELVWITARAAPNSKTS